MFLFRKELLLFMPSKHLEVECLLELLKEHRQLNPPHPMPLQKSPSKKAFVENLKAELKSGRDKKQALAIAYSVQRQSKREKYRGK
jgi:hypothetical protein